MRNLVLANTKVTSATINIYHHALSHADDDSLIVNKGRGYTAGVKIDGNVQVTGTLTQASSIVLMVLAYDPYVDAATMARFGGHKVEFDDLLRRADFISLHSPLTPETHHLLDRRAFALMRDGVVVINTSRGPLIDEQALLEALRSGKVLGGGLDVMEHEPPPLDSPLRDFDTVTMTPHVGANSEQSVTDLYHTACRIVVAVASGGWPDGVVNPEVGGRTAHRYQRR